MTEKRWIILILVLFSILGFIYAVVTPIFEASDELWHYPMVKHLADGNALPVQVFDPDEAGPWKQEASQPPLYYYLGAALTWWIDTSDMEEIRWLNPHVDNGVITKDGNTNLVVHDPATNLWQGTSLAVRIVRFASVILGAVTVYLTFQIAKYTAPDKPAVYLGAAAANAFLPMFLFISGAVNNDNLVVTLSSLTLLLIVRYAVSSKDSKFISKHDLLYVLIIGFAIGLGALTKISALGLTALALVGIGAKQWMRNQNSGIENEQQESVRLDYGKIVGATAGRFGLVLLMVLLISGWWYVRNIQLYGDWSGWNAFIAVLGQRATPANVAQLWDERWGFTISYWGLFGGLNIPMPTWIYWVLNILAVAAAIGFLIYIAGILRSWWRRRRRSILGFGTFVISLVDLLTENITLVLCLLWIAAVVVGLVRWATVTWSSQGRLVFSALSAICTVFMLGLVGWLPERLAKITAGGLSLFLLVISSVAPFLWIEPAYLVPSWDVSDFRVVNVNFNESIQLKGYSYSPETVQPGDELQVDLQWEVLRPMSEDWSVFIHLNDPALDLPAAQRDMYHGQGLKPTSLLKPGEIINNRYVLQLPQTAVAPADLELTVGLYMFDAGERLETESGEDSVVLDEIRLNAHPGDVPNPISVSFEDLFELVGFSIENRHPDPGESVELDLYYRLKKNVSEDFSFFAQLVSEDTTRWASQDLIQTTSTWEPGDLQQLHFSLQLEEDTPSGILPIIVGIYTRTEDGGFDRLQRLSEEGHLTDDFLKLTDVRVDG
ncbi:MAG: hypothetical protein ACK2T3_02705 [Candidatus Promineifilaceae bacterium]